MTLPANPDLALRVGDQRESVVRRLQQRLGAAVEFVAEPPLGRGQQQPFVGQPRADRANRSRSNGRSARARRLTSPSAATARQSSARARNSLTRTAVRGLRKRCHSFMEGVDRGLPPPSSSALCAARQPSARGLYSPAAKPARDQERPISPDTLSSRSLRRRTIRAGYTPPRRCSRSIRRPSPRGASARPCGNRSGPHAATARSMSPACPCDRSVLGDQLHTARSTASGAEAAADRRSRLGSGDQRTEFGDPVRARQ